MKGKEEPIKSKNGSSIDHFSLMNQLDNLHKKSEEVRRQIEVQKQERLNGNA